MSQDNLAWNDGESPTSEEKDLGESSVPLGSTQQTQQTQAALTQHQPSQFDLAALAHKLNNYRPVSPSSAHSSGSPAHHPPEESPRSFPQFRSPSHSDSPSASPPETPTRDATVAREGPLGFSTPRQTSPSLVASLPASPFIPTQPITDTQLDSHHVDLEALFVKGQTSKSSAPSASVASLSTTVEPSPILESKEALVPNLRPHPTSPYVLSVAPSGEKKGSLTAPQFSFPASAAKRTPPTKAEQGAGLKKSPIAPQFHLPSQPRKRLAPSSPLASPPPPQRRATLAPLESPPPSARLVASPPQRNLLLPALGATPSKSPAPAITKIQMFLPSRPKTTGIPSTYLFPRHCVHCVTPSPLVARLPRRPHNTRIQCRAPLYDCSYRPLFPGF